MILCKNTGHYVNGPALAAVFISLSTVIVTTNARFQKVENI